MLVSEPAFVFFLGVLTPIANKVELFGGFLDFILPPLCLGCGQFDDSPVDVCSACLEAIDTYDNPICLNCFEPVTSGPVCRNCQDRSFPLFAFGDYTAPLKDVVIQFKFKGITSPASLFADLIVDKFEVNLAAQSADFLVPIPLHPSRQARRGYNQAALLAERLSERLNLPVDNDIIERVKRRRPQARLDLRHRARNINSVFEAIPTEVENTGLILVDDVVTSGATMLEARHTLEKAGHRVVAAVAIAHGR